MKVSPLICLFSLLLCLSCTRTVYVGTADRHEGHIHDSTATARSKTELTHTGDTVLVRTAFKNDTVFLTTEKTHWRTRTTTRYDTVVQITRDTVRTVQTVTREAPPRRRAFAVEFIIWTFLAVSIAAVLIRSLKN